MSSGKKVGSLNLGLQPVNCTGDYWGKIHAKIQNNRPIGGI